MSTFLPIIQTVDNFRPSASDERLVPWTLCTSSVHAFGLLRPQIHDLLQADNDVRTKIGQPPSWCFHRSGDRLDRVSFAAHLALPSARSLAMEGLCEGWRDSGLFVDVIGPRKWRAELYAVYANPFRAHVHARPVTTDGTAEDALATGCDNYLFSMERTACALFGVVTFGVHMNVYEVEDGKTMVWVPRRAKTKQT
jgi:hypothetical protein